MALRRFITSSLWLAASLLAGSFPAFSQTPLQQPAPPSNTESAAAPAPDAPNIDNSFKQPAQPSQPQPDRRLPATITGRVVDQTGAQVVGAQVKIFPGPSRPAIQSDAVTPPSAAPPDVPIQDAQTDDDGAFFFSNLAPGPYHLEITLDGFAMQILSTTLHSGENRAVPQIALTLATSATEVRVTPSRVEIAEDQIKEQEKQRVLGVFPNFYVTYVHDAAPLTPKQKFELAWKSTVDPVNFAIIGVIAGVQQSQNDFGGYGQGTQGYAKRYGASFGDSVTETFIGGAILPTLLKQDPRYFYKGTGTRRSRVLYALANAVICKGDNGRWQPNYSSLLGNLAAGGISNLYYPPNDRSGAGLTMETALIGIGATAATNLLEEFVIRRFTPGASHDPNRDSGHDADHDTIHDSLKPQNLIGKLFFKPLHSGD
jgi:hypothetical protein